VSCRARAPASDVAALTARRFGGCRTATSSTVSCQKFGVYVQVIPEGVDLKPPQQSVKQLGKVNHSLREEQDRLNYVFDMMDGADFEEEGPFIAAETLGSFE